MVTSLTSRAKPARPTAERRYAEVVVDHQDLRLGPAERHRPLTQPELQPGRLVWSRTCGLVDWRT